MKKKTVVKNRFFTYLVSFFSIALLAISIFLIISSLNIKTSSKVQLLSYNEKSNVDYNVYLKPNNYFVEEYLPKDKQYISSVIDYIDIFYNYNFSSSKKIDADYEYKVVATLEAKYKIDSSNSKQIWSNDYVLVENKLSSVKDEGNISINENVKVNYEDFNKIINSFKKDYMLSVNSDLTVKLFIKVNGKYVPADKVFNLNNELSVVIPMSQQTIDIKTNYEEIKNDQIVTIEKIDKIKNYYFLILGISMAFIFVIILILQISKVIIDDKKQSLYIKELKKILHDYGDIIVEVKKAPKISKEKSSEVKSFNELVNAQIELRTPIIFSEIIKNELGLFVIFDNDYAYYYSIKSNEGKKKKV